MTKFLFLAIVLLAGACASYDGSSLRAGASTEADARSVMGTPGHEYVAADGTRGLLFPRGPLGTQTFAVEVAPDGKVRDVRQVLNDGTFGRIRPGMTQKEVLDLIGPPGETMHFARTNTTSWDYRYVDTWGYLSIFSVISDANGVVVSKLTKRIDRPEAR
jgi:hypothetical protein